MPWPWDPPPPPAPDAVSIPHDNSRSSKLPDNNSEYAGGTFAQSLGHPSTHQRVEDGSQAQANRPALCLGDFGTVLSFLHLEKRHSSLRNFGNTSALFDHHTNTSPSRPEVTDVSLVEAPHSENGLWDLSMAMRYLEAHRMLHYSEPTTTQHNQPPLTLTTSKDASPHNWTAKLDLPGEISYDDAGMTTSVDISVNHTDDGATMLASLHDQSQGTKGDRPDNDGLLEPAGARRRITKKSARTMPIDEPTSSSNGGGHSSESEHKAGTEPGSGPDDHSDTPSRGNKASGSDKPLFDLNVQSQPLQPAQTLTTPNTALKKKRPWRAAKVLKEMKALFLAEQREQQEQHTREQLHCQDIVDRQKPGDSKGQVSRQKLCGTVSTSIIPVALEDEQESVIDHTPGCEPLIFQRPRSHYRNFWRPWDQDPTMEDGPTLPSLGCTTFASTTSTQSLSEEQCAGKKLLAMRVRDTFLVPNGVTHLVNALSQARADVSFDAEQPIVSAVKDRVDNEDDIVEEGALNSTARFSDRIKTSFTQQEVDTQVAPSDRVFIFVDNSNILTGFYQHHQVHSSTQRGQGPTSESRPVETVQMSPSASPLATTQDISSITPEKHGLTDTDSDEETVLYPCPHRDKLKLTNAALNDLSKERAKDGVNDVPLFTEVNTSDLHDGPSVSVTTTDGPSKSHQTPTAPSGAKMVRGSHLLPKFDYNKFFELLRKNRPAARQVLVGSSPLFQELDEALEHQYETIILRRVRKFVQGELGALPVPVKQLRYPSNNSSHNSAAVVAPPGSNGGAADSSVSPGTRKTDVDATFQVKSPCQLPATGDSETQHTMATTTLATTPPALAPAPAAVANGEQGVDELLHLKMLETLLDHEPATMVLATGDGGDSEFGGGGFYGVIRRALDRGWQVEVVSWEDLLSGAYLELALEYGYTDRDHRTGSSSRHLQSRYRPTQHQHPHHHQHHHQHQHQQQYQYQHRMSKLKMPLQRRSAHAEGRRTQGHLRVWCLDWYGDLFLQK
ncbi:hypothetical protein EC968_001633 [Mortierella alpina]|nr:hypothetical protein EC968_001633 [Mortierella alpina]